MNTSTPAIQVSAIDHINLSTAQLDTTIDFYQRVLGFDIREDHRNEEPRYVILGSGQGAFLAIHENPDSRVPQHEYINHWGFVVGDLDQARQRLQDLGVDWLYPQRNNGLIIYPHSRSSYIADPDGREIELVEVFGGGN